MSGLETLALAAGASAGTASTIGTIGTIASVGGSVLSGLGQIQAGKAAKTSANFQAAQLRQQAGQEVASSQRVALEERRRSGIAMSNAQAAAAASGGGATDPTVMNITGGLAKQGEYNALSALFEGEEKARGLRLGATSAQMEGKQAAKAGKMAGASTIIGGLGSAGMAYAKYNPAASSSTLPWQTAGNVRPKIMGGGYYS